MDLKNTKATEHCTNVNKFKHLVQVRGIAKASEELKNTSVNYSKSQALGYRAEQNVIKLLQSENWILCFHRLKTDIAEIDLIFEKNNKVLLIEVKTLNNSWRAFERIQKKQLSKLQSNLGLFSRQFHAYEFHAYVAWVDPQNRISFVAAG